MNVPTLLEIKSKWNKLKSQLSQKGEKEAESQDNLKQLLRECTGAGKLIKDTIDRDNLQWTAQEIGDTIFSLTNQYPDIIISPYLGSQSASKPLTCNLPQNNPFFTGRDDILQFLRDELTKEDASKSTHKQAISGLGGIGKTQLAVEYAHLYREQYDAIFWVRAYTEFELKTGFVDIARCLDLPEKYEQNFDDIVDAVKRWLESNSNWLLIFDNADKPELVKRFFPNNPKGHILLTSRAQIFDVVGIAKPIELTMMPADEAREFLFKRTGREDSNSQEAEAAEELALELGCLALALEQAGAFISAKKARFQNYLISYRKRRFELLKQSKPIAGNHPESVDITWLTNFQEVEQTSAAAADLLSFSAFLSPDYIPFELITQGACELGSVISVTLADVDDDPLILDDVFEPLTRYSLISYDPKSQIYSIHHLVQEVLKYRMDADTRRDWAQRTVRAVNRVFPPVESFNQKLCDRLLPHAKIAAKLVKHYQFEFNEAANLAYRTGYYLFTRFQYVEAERLLKQALELRKRLLGDEHLDVANSLNALAELYREWGRYRDAEPLYQQALSMKKRLLEEEHPDVATILSNLAELYHRQWRLSELEPLYLNALKLKKRLLGEEHQDVATILNNLAEFYSSQGRYTEAERLYKQALDLRKRALGENHQDVAQTLNNLARLYCIQGLYTQAESLFKKALKIGRCRLGEENLYVSRSLNDLGRLYSVWGRYSEAVPLYEKALNINRRLLGEEHPYVAINLNNLAELYRLQGRYIEAEPLLVQALELKKSLLGEEHPDVATSLNNLALLYTTLARYQEAEPLFMDSLELRERAFKQEHRDVAASLSNLASLYQSQGRYSEAEPLYMRSLQMRKKLLGEDHPDVASSLSNLASLYQCQGRYSEAEPLYMQALKLSRCRLGEEHSDVANNLNNLAELYRLQGRYSEAEPFLKQALALKKRLLGENHPDIATILNYLGLLYFNQGRCNEAEPLYKEALSMRKRLLGEDHPDVAIIVSNLALLYSAQGRYAEAESSYTNALKILKQTIGENHPELGRILDNLAMLYSAQGCDAKAKPLFVKALEILERKLGADHPWTVRCRDNLEAQPK
jgi:tetratricopeptide (TPR) repeat protein